MMSKAYPELEANKTYQILIRQLESIQLGDRVAEGSELLEEKIAEITASDAHKLASDFTNNSNANRAYKNRLRSNSSSLVWGAYLSALRIKISLSV